MFKNFLIYYYEICGFLFFKSKKIFNTLLKKISKKKENKSKNLKII